MKFFSTNQIPEIDQYCIEHKPIASIDLMEQASQCLYIEVLRRVSSDQSILIFAGPGNNGGDALALARMLLQSTLQVRVILLHSGKLSNDCETNRRRLIDKFPAALSEQTETFEAPIINKNSIIIDGLFGSGLSRPLTGIYSDAVKWINQSNCKVIAIDIPSGLQDEQNPDLSFPIVKANLTLSLQFPKLAFLFPENVGYVGEWKVIDIGILSEAIQSTPSKYYFLETADITPIVKERSKFSHKGTFGHALIVAGSKGMAGASALASKAALRSGAGLVTVRGPECNRTIVQTVVPEVIFQSDIHHFLCSKVPNSEKFNAIALGPGIGTKRETVGMLKEFLSSYEKPCILDADALNCIALQKELVHLIPKNSILTPHPKEFERLFGECKSSLERVQKTCEMAQNHELIIILKGAHTVIATSDGKLYFNSTGNAGMATAGSGDVLTGILVGLLAQGYSPDETAKLGVFLHGRAGDLALNNQTTESLIASDIILHIAEAFRTLKVK